MKRRDANDIGVANSELIRLSHNILAAIGENENATVQAALKIAALLHEHKSCIEYQKYLSTLASR